MRVEDQTEVLEFLGNPASYGMPDGTRVATAGTHISSIFLVGRCAFKLKRAVQLPYVDFSTAARRLAACRDEVRLNRRTAPMLYTGVRRITREADGRLAFDGQGELVDAVVEMNRFDQRDVFEERAAQGRLDPAMLTELARVVARTHDHADVVHRRGGAAGIATVLDGNERALDGAHFLPVGLGAALSAGLRAAFHGHEALLDARERAGKVRWCHGDLHLRNICLIDGKPVLFDCLEFDEAMATIDVLYDLAFLVMDLWRHGLRSEANLVFNRYLDERDEVEGLPLMPFFMAMRAGIRAHVTAEQAGRSTGPRRAALVSEAQAYAVLAMRLLAPVPGRMVAIGGLSGTGKSTVAAAIADQLGPAPGARVLESDRIRKRLHGVRAEARLSEQAYRPAVSARVYADLARDARAVLDSRHAVVVDAVFERMACRECIERVAREACVPFTGIWLHARAQTLLARVDARRGDASDATAEVVRAQMAAQSGPVPWVRIDADAPPGEVAARVMRTMETT